MMVGSSPFFNRSVDQSIVNCESRTMDRVRARTAALSRAQQHDAKRIATMSMNNLGAMSMNLGHHGPAQSCSIQTQRVALHDTTQQQKTLAAEKQMKLRNTIQVPRLYVHDSVPGRVKRSSAVVAVWTHPTAVVIFSGLCGGARWGVGNTLMNDYPTAEKPCFPGPGAASHTCATQPVPHSMCHTACAISGTFRCLWFSCTLSFLR